VSETRLLGIVIALAALLIGVVALRLYRRGRENRAATIVFERRAQWADHLQELTAALSRAATPTAVFDASLTEFLHAIGAAAGIIVLISEDTKSGEVAHTVGHDEKNVFPPGHRFALVESRLADAVRRRELVTIDPTVPSNAKLADSPVTSAFGPYRTAVVVPLIGKGHVLGILVVAFQSVREISGDEETFLMTGGRRTAEALVRARVYEASQRARSAAEHLQLRADQELRERQKAEEALRESETKYRALAARTGRLYKLSAALSESISLEAVAIAIVRHGKTVAGASAGSVALLVEGGREFQTLHAEEYAGEAVEAWDRFSAAHGLCSTAAVETRQPVFVSSFEEWRERYPASASIGADGGFASVAALPLTVEGTPIGVLTFHFTAPVSFDSEYRALLVSIAQHCAQALDRARLYESTERARRDAEAANRSKDDFLSTVSHELRTPLTAVLGWASMLRSGSLDASRSTRAIEAIYNNATRQAHMIDELLDVSRIVAGRAVLDVQDVDLGRSIQGAVEAVMPLAEGKGIDLHLGAHPSVPIRADPRRLEQIFMNLLSNAIKFTPPGGRVAVESAITGSLAAVRVADTGSGIDRGLLPHVFDRFWQAESNTARSVGGLGLGLFIARQLVEAQSGSIRADSEGPNLGATFTVSFPVASERHPAAPIPSELIRASAAAAPVQARSLKGVQVLLVDDEPDVRELMTAALEGSGAAVTAVASAREAIRSLSRKNADVLLADIAMPGEDGYDLIRQIRGLPEERKARIPAAAVTACAREDERQRALGAGFQMHLAKPIDPVDLVEAVTVLLRVGAAC
jgi:signal transduction histidine kinase/CheY-like chemotaxis protein